MDVKELQIWINDVLPKHRILTQTVETIIENLLNAEKIDYLSVIGRTKSEEDVKEKIKRKSYGAPANQLTDISGIRIIVYLESDIVRVSKLISSSFNVDEKNSMDKQSLGSTRKRMGNFRIK